MLFGDLKDGGKLHITVKDNEIAPETKKEQVVETT